MALRRVVPLVLFAGILLLPARAQDPGSDPTELLFTAWSLARSVFPGLPDLPAMVAPSDEVERVVTGKYSDYLPIEALGVFDPPGRHPGIRGLVRIDADLMRKFEQRTYYKCPAQDADKGDGNGEHVDKDRPPTSYSFAVSPGAYEKLKDYPDYLASMRRCGARFEPIHEVGGIEQDRKDSASGHGNPDETGLCNADGVFGLGAYVPSLAGKERFYLLVGSTCTPSRPAFIRVPGAELYAPAIKLSLQLLKRRDKRDHCLARVEDEPVLKGESKDMTEEAKKCLKD